VGLVGGKDISNQLKGSPKKRGQRFSENRIDSRGKMWVIWVKVIGSLEYQRPVSSTASMRKLNISSNHLGARIYIGMRQIP